MGMTLPFQQDQRTPRASGRDEGREERDLTVTEKKRSTKKEESKKRKRSNLKRTKKEVIVYKN